MNNKRLIQFYPLFNFIFFGEKLIIIIHLITTPQNKGKNLNQGKIIQCTTDIHELHNVM